MSPKLLIPAVLAGLLAGYLLWGRGPIPAEFTAAITRAERAETLAAQNTRIAALWIGTAYQWRLTSDSLARLAAIPRLRTRQQAETASVALSEGDTAKAVASLLEAVASCRVALTLDSLALEACRASGAAKDSALTVFGVTVDSLRAAGRQSIGVLKRVKPKPWTIGAVYGDKIWGAFVTREVGFLAVLGSLDESGVVRAGVGIRF